MSSSPIKVFLPACSEEQISLRNALASVLQSAEMQVILAEENTFNIGISPTIHQHLSDADCSVHILFPQYFPLLESDAAMSIAKFQFYEAKKHLEINSNFKMFVWLPPSTNSSTTDSLQAEFINEVRNNISKNMVFSNESSTIQLVDDIRSLMEVKEALILNLNSTDVFLIFNQVDEVEAGEILDMLNDVVPIENLNIIQDEDIDYSELCKQQIPQSNLAVVYYKLTSDWAIPFAQQVWKKIGGASSPTPILLIGDAEANADNPKKFVAQRVISMLVDGELIPLEIKVQYDKVVGS